MMHASCSTSFSPGNSGYPVYSSAGYGRPHHARHVMSCHSTQETRVYNDPAGNGPGRY